jgi:hypothetical protein
MGFPLHSVSNTDTINIQDEAPKISAISYFENEDTNIAPFYITLTIHDQLLHNLMLDSGASHNLMPKVIMEKLGLDVNKPYKCLYTFDSKKFQCLGLITDLFLNLDHIPNKSVVMDIVVVDVPPSFGMLLSRSSCAKLGGTIQLDI